MPSPTSKTPKPQTSATIMAKVRAARKTQKLRPIPGVPPIAPIRGAETAPLVLQRTRSEIRQSMQAFFDTTLREILEQDAKAVHTRLVRQRAKAAKAKPGEEVWDELDSKTRQGIQATAQLYAGTAIGSLGMGTPDPAEIPNLPAPVFATIDPNAPLPDGAPE